MWQFSGTNCKLCLILRLVDQANAYRGSHEASHWSSGKYIAHIGIGINTLRPRQNGRHFTDDIFKCIFVNENVLIPINISRKFVSKGSINYIPALVQIMAWRPAGDKPLSEPMTISLPMHICTTRPHWVKKMADILVTTFFNAIF